MMRALVSMVLAITLHILSLGKADAGALLQVEGSVLKWKSQEPGATTTKITYAVLTGPYTVPSDKSVLSPDNCGAMHAFANIVNVSPGISEAAAMHELRLAVAAWAEVANITFVEVENAREANIVIGATAKPEGRAYANLSYRSGKGAKPVEKALGMSGPDISEIANKAASNDEVAAIEQAYICLNPRARWKVGFDGNLDVYDLRHTFTHEIGHAIGLDHPGRPGALMDFRYNERVRELQPSDIAAIQKLYGPRKREE